LGKFRDRVRQTRILLFKNDQIVTGGMKLEEVTRP